MNIEQRLFSYDRARRQRTIREVRTRLRRRRRQEFYRETLRPILGMAFVLLVVIFGTRAINNWVDRLIEEVDQIPVATVAEASTVEVKEVADNTKVVVATITAYTSSPDETDDTPFITASGARTGRGTIACPPKYDFGTQVEIEGRQYTCEDRMNRRYHSQERFDIWVETKSEAYKWGIKEVEIKITYER